MMMMMMMMMMMVMMMMMMVVVVVVVVVIMTHALYCRYVQRGSLWDMLRRAQADPALLPWGRRLKFAAEVTPSAGCCSICC